MKLYFERRIRKWKKTMVKMKRSRILGFIILAVMLLGLVLTVNASTMEEGEEGKLINSIEITTKKATSRSGEKEVTILYNGRFVEFTNSDAIIVDGTVMVPVDFMKHVMDEDVWITFDGNTNALLVNKFERD